MALVLHFPRREAQALGLIGLAHFLSHVFTLGLAPLLPSITRDLGISYAQFGLIIASFSITTGVLQTPMGFLVERVGGRTVLIAGLILNSICFMIAGWFATNLWQMVLLMALAGVGNAVFHPADYSLLSSAIGKSRVGQAYSVHSFLGIGGLIVGPIMTTALFPIWTWSRMNEPGSIRALSRVVSSIGTALLRRSYSRCESVMTDALASKNAAARSAVVKNSFDSSVPNAFASSISRPAN